MKHIERIGHRGAAGYAPENTIASIKKALELGVDMVEFDVRPSGIYSRPTDARLFTIHDETLDRTTNGKGLVSNKTFLEIKRLDAGNGEKVPTLEQVLDVIGEHNQINATRVKANIEGKEGSAGLAAKVVQRYQEKHGADGNIIFSSFHLYELNRFKREQPDVPLGLLIGKRNTARTLETAHRLAVSFIGIDKSQVTPEFVDRAHEEGQRVFVFTANTPKEIAKMKELGVDGIFSNFPDRI